MWASGCLFSRSAIKRFRFIRAESRGRIFIELVGRSRGGVWDCEKEWKILLPQERERKKRGSRGEERRESRQLTSSSPLFSFPQPFSRPQRKRLLSFHEREHSCVMR